MQAYRKTTNIIFIPMEKKKSWKPENPEACWKKASLALASVFLERAGLQTSLLPQQLQRSSGQSRLLMPCVSPQQRPIRSCYLSAQQNHGVKGGPTWFMKVVHWTFWPSLRQWEHEDWFKAFSFQCYKHVLCSPSLQARLVVEAITLCYSQEKRGARAIHYQFSINQCKTSGTSFLYFIVNGLVIHVVRAS